MLVKYKRIIMVIAVIILTLALSACKSADMGVSEHNNDSATQASATEAMIPGSFSETGDVLTSESASPVPNRRISVVRPGAGYVLQTESGLYVVVSERVATPENENFFLDFVLYCDHASDEFVKLCGRADCLHNTADCDACLGNIFEGMGYYDGSIYYFQNAAVDNTRGCALFKMDPDGRNKEMILSIEPDTQKTGKTTSTTYGGMEFFNGYFMMYFGKLDEDGMEIFESRYTSLKQPETLKPTALGLKYPTFDANNVLYSNGDAILVDGGPDGDQSTDQQGLPIYTYLYAWDPSSNSVEPIGDKPGMWEGYYDREGGIFIQDGKIFRWHYENHQTELLFDTGLTGKHRLYCYPDCLVVSERRDLDEERMDTVSLWFYNWDYRYLGSCQVRLAEKIRYTSAMLEETETRILVCNALGTRPLWYIEKSDFGKEEIPLHEYHYPEMDLSW